MKTLSVSRFLFQASLMMIPCVALAEQVKTEEKLMEPAGPFYLFLIYLFLVWAYPINKWRLWKQGFSRGRANAGVFIKAIKWTVIGTILTAIPLIVIAYHVGK